MKTKYLLIALPLVALCACNKEGVETNDTKVATITATCNEDTKTVLDGYTMTWEANDAIKVSYLPEELSAPTTSAFVIADSWRFDNTSAAGPTAVFSSSTFPTTPGFADGETYVAIYPWMDGEQENIMTLVPKSAESTEIAAYRSYIIINKNQTYNPANSYGLVNGAIPMAALIKEGTNNFNHNQVSFTSVCAVLKLSLTNTGSAKTIGKITVETDNEKRNGLAGKYIIQVSRAEPHFSSRESGWLSASGASNMITLDCGGATINAGQTKVFSFFVPGTGRNGGLDFGTLTWKVYDEAGDQIGADIKSTSVKIQNNRVYTKNATL